MPDIQPVRLRKASGVTELFNQQKLTESMNRASIPPEIQRQVMEHVRTQLRDNMSTDEIYRLVQDVFRKHYRVGACRYSLKHAIADFGPSGYPFERFVGEVLRHYGYQVAVSTIVQGKCVSHEVDVLATKDGKTAMVECKFHSEHGNRSDVKVALYVHARFMDIAARGAAHGISPYRQAWIVTNTKFTSDAIAYAECSGMQAIGWSYPKEHNLQRMVESSGLYPVTCLSTLSKSQIDDMLAKNIVLARDVMHIPEARELIETTP